jgi:hypothetical protein
MGKEKAIGALIFIGALLVLLYYTWGLIILELLPSLRVDVNNVFGEGSLLASLFNPPAMVLVILPIWLGVVLIMVIAMWIGWTMLTTPAPEPLEDFDFDEEKVAESKPALGPSKLIFILQSSVYTCC